MLATDFGNLWKNTECKTKEERKLTTTTNTTLLALASARTALIITRSWEGTQLGRLTQTGKTNRVFDTEQEGGPRELQASQPHLHPGKGDGAAYSGGHQQASGGKAGYQE